MVYARRRFERRDFVGAQGHRRRGLDAVVHAGAVGHGHHVVETHHLRHFDGGHVEGVRQRLAQRHVAVELVLEVARLVGLAVEPEGRGLVHHHGTGGQQARPSGNGRIERRGIHERLENRTRLPLGEHVVELAHSVVAPARQRLDLAGVRDRWPPAPPAASGRRLAAEAALPADLLVHALHAGAHGLFGGPLQAQIQGGIDAERVGLHIRILELATAWSRSPGPRSRAPRPTAPPRAPRSGALPPPAPSRDR